MANVKVIRDTEKKIIKKMVEVEEVVETSLPPKFVLTLSEEEATTLKSICGKLSGPQDSASDPRRHTSSIFYALDKVGISSGAVKMSVFGPVDGKNSSDYVETDNIRIEKK